MALRGPLSPHQAPGRGRATARDPSQAAPPSMATWEKAIVWSPAATEPPVGF
ncbi:hypothetical protein M885DRAFT_531323 [Pelagophyceae sp. CCMP2097]|nr:hypothetical protein M885DRAFT_531323 [Pelagophyceae sp. CCMP2097]